MRLPQRRDEGCVPPFPRGAHLPGALNNREKRQVSGARVPKGADAFYHHRHHDRHDEAQPAKATQRRDHRDEHPDQQRQEVRHVARAPGYAGPPVGFSVENDLQDDAR